MAKKTATRKCYICNEEFSVSNIPYLKIKKRYCEIECFINQQLNKGLSMSSIDSLINNYLNEMKIEENEKAQKELDKIENNNKAKLKENERNKNKDDLVEYIYKEYEVSSLPKIFFIKLNEINTGAYKGLNVGIPYEDLLDMLKRKQNYLRRIYMNNVTNGKEMTTIQRINYDLAVIVNKYDDYLKWKEKQVILESDIEKDKKEYEKEKDIDYSKIGSKNTSIEDDISSIIDDIY